MLNKDIRNEIKQAGVTYWQVAKALGIADGTFTRWLRFELEGDKRQRVLEAIKKAAADKTTA